MSPRDLLSFRHDRGTLNRYIIPTVSLSARTLNRILLNRHRARLATYMLATLVKIGCYSATTEANTPNVRGHTFSRAV